jgi:hypothetical protein
MWPALITPIYNDDGYGLCNPCRYPEDRVPPYISSKSRQGAGRVFTRCHTSCSSGPRLPAEVGFGAATCPAAPAPAASPGQLRGHHVPCGSSSRCPARGSSGATTCPAAPAPAAQPGAAPGPSRVPWRPNGLRAIKVIRYPPSVGMCASSETPHDKQTPCACKTCGQRRLQGCNSAASTRCPYTADRYSTG